MNSGSGHITVLAPANVTLTATADVRTGGTGTIDVIAGTGAFTQDDDSRLISGTGDIRVHAHTSIYLGGLTTGGNASLIAETGSILDQGDIGGEDLIADGLRHVAAIGVGTPTDHLETKVTTLTARQRPVAFISPRPTA